MEEKSTNLKIPNRVSDGQSRFSYWDFGPLNLFRI